MVALQLFISGVAGFDFTAPPEFRQNVCSRLLFGEAYTSPYNADDPPLCIQLTEGAKIEIEVAPPTADVCFDFERRPRRGPVLSASTYTAPHRCLSPADQGRITMRLPADVSDDDERDDPQLYLIRTSTPPASAQRLSITTTVTGGAPGTLLRSALAPPPPACPSPSVSAACSAEEKRAIDLCNPDLAKLHSLYPNCRARDCTADQVGCLLAHRAELAPECGRALGGVTSCCPKPPKAHRCPAQEGQAIARCANETARLQAQWPRQCWAGNCTASVVGCLLAHQGALRSASCVAAVADVAGCCPSSSAETRCAEQEDAVAVLCQADVSALQQLLPHECWATHCEADMASCLVGNQDLLRDAKCAQAVRALASCTKGAWDLLGPMVIAAYLLLATASVVLLCTVLRCCVRCLCTATGLASLQEDLAPSDEDEAGTEDDELGSVTPLPSGVKQQKALTQEEEEENALPGYSEVVEGASIPLQPTSSSTSSMS